MDAKQKERLYRLAKRKIERGQTDGLEEKLTYLWIGGELTDEHYNELIAMLHPKQ